MLSGVKGAFSNGIFWKNAGQCDVCAMEVNVDSGGKAAKQKNKSTVKISAKNK